MIDHGTGRKYFDEITTFLNFEQGTSRVGNSNALDFPH